MTAPIAVVLAGGPGTRLRPLTENMPKAMVPVQGKPLTEHVLDILRHNGVNKVVLSLCYLAEQVRSHFGKSWNGMDISYAIEAKPMGTGGALYLIERPKLPFMILNGDNLSTLDLRAFMRFHSEKEKEGAMASIALVEVEDTSQFGVADLKRDKIARFIEKPKPEEAPSKWINAGYYIFSPEIFSILPDKHHCMLETDIFPRLASEGRLFGFRGKGQWWPTDDFERYELVQREWKGPRREEL